MDGSLREHSFEFDGRGGEYFKIWIVNIVLTVITFGLYIAWAKVRTRRYLYGSTSIDDRTFDYLASPGTLFVSYIVMGLAVILLQTSMNFLPVVGLVLLGIYTVLFPWLMYKSLRFKTHNSAYSNVRLSFHGSCIEAYVIYLLLPILNIFTIGLLTPYIAMRAKRFVFGNIALGRTKAQCDIRSGPFYRWYFSTLGTLTAISLVSALFVLGYIETMPPEEKQPATEEVTADYYGEDGRELTDEERAKAAVLQGAIIAGTFSVYLLFFFIIFLIQSYLYVRSTNYAMGRTMLGHCQLYCRMRVRTIFWITITNFFLTVMTLGLYTPWARVRTARYRVESMSVISTGSLQRFIAERHAEQSALGDAAAEFFDFEFGF